MHIPELACVAQRDGKCQSSSKSHCIGLELRKDATTSARQWICPTRECAAFLINAITQCASLRWRLFSVPPAGGAGKGELHSQARLQFLRKFRILCSQLPVLRRFNGNLGLRVLLNLAQPFDTGGGSGIHRELLV